MLSKEASNTIFRVFGISRPGIEPWSPRPLTNTLSIMLMSRNWMQWRLRFMFCLNWSNAKIKSTFVTKIRFNFINFTRCLQNVIDVDSLGRMFVYMILLFSDIDHFKKYNLIWNKAPWVELPWTIQLIILLEIILLNLAIR